MANKKKFNILQQQPTYSCVACFFFCFVYKMFKLLFSISLIVHITAVSQQWLAYDDMEYYLANDSVDYDVAETKCSTMDSQLAAVYNEGILHFLQGCPN